MKDDTKNNVGAWLNDETSDCWSSLWERIRIKDKPFLRDFLKDGHTADTARSNNGSTNSL